MLAMCLCATARPWSEDVIYFAMTDRFRDADTSNNIPKGSDPKLYDPTQKNINLYHGGDLRGLEKAIQSGYFNDLGVTALWLTPVLKNVWRSGYDLGGWKSGYHGYWTQDWLDIDPHLVSRESLDGKPYSDDANGRMEHYRDFVKLAHSKGIKVIQDIVLNHAGPVFYYDADSDNVFDEGEKDEWVQPFKRDGYHAHAKWADVPRWNVAKVQPDGPRELLGKSIEIRGTLARLESYGRKGFSPDSLGKTDGEEVECDFFSLRDFWTDPQGEHFDALVDEFVTIYDFYLGHVGVDGLRIDTIKHVHHEFWDAFTERLRSRLGTKAADKLLFGEIYDGNPEVLGRYTWRSDWPTSKEPGLDGVLDFQFCFSAREYLRHPDGQYGSPAALEKALLTRTSSDSKGRPVYNPNPGPDGLNAQQKIITFIENHDGLNRFRVAGVSERRNRLAQGLVLTLPGIPCIYYGTENSVADADGKIGEDGETGRFTYFPRVGSAPIDAVKQSASFREISALTSLREKLPVLRTGSFIPLWSDSGDDSSDDGVLAYARASEDGESFAVVVINASSEARVTGTANQSMSLPHTLKIYGKQLRPVLTIGGESAGDAQSFDAAEPLRLPVPAESLVVYQAELQAVGAAQN